MNIGHSTDKLDELFDADFTKKKKLEKWTYGVGYGHMDTSDRSVFHVKLQMLI